MRKYFYIDSHNQQRGPVDANQLPMMGVTSNTYVWTEGMRDWKMVSDIPKLSVLFPKQQMSQDNSYQASYSQPGVSDSVTNENVEYTSSIATPQPMSFWKKTMALWFALGCFALAALLFWLLVYVFSDGKNHIIRVKTVFLPILLVIYGFKFVIDFIKDSMK